MGNPKTVLVVAESEGGFRRINATSVDFDVHTLYGTQEEQEAAVAVIADEQAKAAGNAFRPLRNGRPVRASESPESASESEDWDAQRRAAMSETRRAVLDRAAQE